MKRQLQENFIVCWRFQSFWWPNTEKCCMVQFLERHRDSCRFMLKAWWRKPIYRMIF